MNPLFMPTAPTLVSRGAISWPLGGFSSKSYRPPKVRHLTMTPNKRAGASPFESVLLGNILTAVVGLPAMIGHVPSRNSIIGLLLLGIFQLGFAYVLFANASRYVSALEMVLITVIEPILNPLWVVLTIGEKPSFLAMIGGAIVLLAIVGRGIINTRAERKLVNA